jgi:predicted Zn-ribbon and HTH transcriptional regulator
VLPTIKNYIMDEFDVKCCKCGWEGYSDALVSKTEDVKDRDFNYCPDCESDDIEDTDYNEDE